MDSTSSAKGAILFFLGVIVIGVIITNIKTSLLNTPESPNTSSYDYNTQMKTARRQTIALDAQTAAEAANAYFMNESITTGKGFPHTAGEKNCVSIKTLIDKNYFSVSGNYEGKVVVEKPSTGYNYLWTVYLHHDNYMINGEDFTRFNTANYNDYVKDYNSYTFDKDCKANELIHSRACIPAVINKRRGAVGLPS